MADISKPIIICEHLQLLSLGIQPTSIKTLTLESDHFICVREKVHEQDQIIIIDLEDANNVLRRPICADSAIMHPHKKIIALKATRTLQILNIETEHKLKSYVGAEDIVFWKWVSDTTIGMVTDTGVFHWTIADRTSPPQKLFDRHPSLAGAQIINYRATPDEKWLVLIGITENKTNPSAFKVKGAMQLFNRELGVSQPIEGHAASFAEVKLDGYQNITKIFTFAIRTAAHAKLYIVEIDHTSTDPPFVKKVVDIFFPQEASNDFPVAMQVSKKHGIIFLVTKYGFIHLYDLESGTVVYMNRISGDTIFVTASHEATNGIIGVNKKGQVLSVSVDEQTIIPYILTTLNNTGLGFKLASRANLPGVDDLYIEQYQQLLSTGQYSEATKVAANSPRGILRTTQVIESIKRAPAPPGGLSPILQYFGILLEKGGLNHVESLELTRPVLKQGRKQLFDKWLKEDKLTCSEELGDIVRLYDMTLALSVYRRANVSDKVVTCLAEIRQTGKIVSTDGKRFIGENSEEGLSERIIPRKKYTLEPIDIQPFFPTYLSNSEARQAIQRVIESRLEDAPPRLLDTSTGRLCNREAQIDTFKRSPEYNGLLSFILKTSKQSKHIHDVIRKFFQYVMLSHRWEGKELLLHDVQGKSVYKLNYGIAKLRSFCKVARDSGYRWAWSDTCCIDKNNIIELQESLNSMFSWYRYSALTIVYLSDVPSAYAIESGTLAESDWNSRGWTLQELLAARVILFYRRDWSLYLNDGSTNHKKSAAIMKELGDATCINAQALVAFRPEMRDAREKLQWSSGRVTTLQEDIAYSLFGIFGVHLSPIYGEKKQYALGRLLQEIIAQSGDISCLDWVGKSSEFNSCLPASITSYAKPSFVQPSLSEHAMESLVSSLRDAGAEDLASQLCSTLEALSIPRFAHRRLHLPCIVFTITEVTPRAAHERETGFTYAVKAAGLRDLRIITKDKLIPFSPTSPIQQQFLLIHPWARNLLEQHDYSQPSNLAADSELSGSRALQFVVRLGQPFSALLLAKKWGREYKRIAADYSIIAQVNNITSVRDVMDVRTLEIL